MSIELLTPVALLSMLAFTMLSPGLGLEIDDFKRVLRKPRAFFSMRSNNVLILD